MEGLLQAFTRALVQDQGSVHVSRYERAGVLVFELDVSPADRGRLIGRRGQTIDCLRTLLDAVARRRGLRCEIEVRD